MAILATEKILTLDYWKPAHKLQVGDYVFDKDGKIVRIKLVQEYRANECYEVTFNDHLAMRGDQHLAFPIETPKYRKRTHEYKGKRKFTRPLKPFRVKELLETPLKTKYNRLAYSIPTTKPLELPHQDLPVPPFVFGMWFFGQRKDRTFSPSIGNGEKVREIFKSHGYKIIERTISPNGERTFEVSPTIESQLLPNIPHQIPDNYLLGSIEQRTQLLQGILCASRRRYYKSDDIFRITSRHIGIISRLQGLVESLGHKTRVEFDESYEYYILWFKSRYVLTEEQDSPRLRVHNARRFIRKIEPIPAQACVHIETTGEDNTILVGEGFISTC